MLFFLSVFPRLYLIYFIPYTWPIICLLHLFICSFYITYSLGKGVSHFFSYRFSFIPWCSSMLYYDVTINLERVRWLWYTLRNRCYESGTCGVGMTGLTDCSRSSCPGWSDVIVFNLVWLDRQTDGPTETNEIKPRFIWRLGQDSLAACLVGWLVD